MLFALLGPLEVRDRGQLVRLKGPNQRRLLAALLLNANRAAPTGDLIRMVWGDNPPETAAHALEVYISEVRKVLRVAGGPERLVKTGQAYVLSASGDDLDLRQFEDLVKQAQQARDSGDLRLGSRFVHQALSLYRGPVLADLGDPPFVVGERQRFEEARLQAVELRNEMDLQLGRHGPLLPELQILVREYPLRERFRSQLMVALYRLGRQAEASDVYQDAQERLREELGMDPGPELQATLKSILTGDERLGFVSQPEPSSKHNLPLRLTSFVGRSRIVTELHQRLSASQRLVTIAGPGGIGKTRLALEVASALVDDFEDGVWLVELAGLTEPILIGDAIASVIGEQLAPGKDPIASLVDRLSSKHILLVLDNCEHLLDAAAQVAHAVLTRCPHVRILATSREPLDLAGEYLERIGPLSVPKATLVLRGEPPGEAMELLIDRARLAGVQIADKELAMATDMCRRLDGLPLALELAAGAMRRMSFTEVAGMLEAHLPLPASSHRMGEVRHRTLEATIGWSYELLTPDERRLLSWLSVFAGTFTIDAAVAVAPSLGGEVSVVLSSLEDKSLVMTQRIENQTRYRMLDTVRSFAQARLTESNEAGSAKDQLLRWESDFSSQVGPSLLGPAQGRAIQAVDVEIDNVRAALAWAAVSGDRRAGVRIAAHLLNYWWMRSVKEGRHHLDTLLAREQELSIDNGWARALLSRGCLLYSEGRLSEAVTDLERSLEMFTTLGEKQAVAECKHWLGRALLVDDASRARQLLEESVAINLEIGEIVAAAMSLISLAGWEIAYGDRVTGIQRLSELRNLIERAGDPPWILAHWAELTAFIEMESRQLPDARDHLIQAITTYVRLESKQCWGHWFETAAVFFTRVGDHEHAATLLGSEERLRSVIGIPVPPDAEYIRSLAQGAATEALGNDGFKDAMAIADGVTPEEIITRAQRWLHSARIVDTSVDRFLTTVLVLDVDKSTERVANIGDAAWRQLLDRHYVITRRQLGQHGGLEVDTAGDGLLATFTGPANAIRCARAIQREDRALGLSVRAGIHCGEVEKAGNAIRGISVHLAARLAAVAKAGDVLISSTARDLAAGSGLKFQERGLIDLKGIPGRREVVAAFD